MPLPKGRTNNPGGRPPKERALTRCMAAELAKLQTLPDGTHVSGKVLLARMRVEAALTGQLTLLDGTTRELTTEQLVNEQEWIYRQVDGPPRAELDVTSEGKALGYDLTDDERAARLATLLDAARARRGGSAADHGPDAVAPAGGTADASLPESGR
jgi:hypothetical protein